MLRHLHFQELCRRVFLQPLLPHEEVWPAQTALVAKRSNRLPATCLLGNQLKATLRHRPDRIIVGEIREGEAFDLPQLLNTGHSGTISTVHANSAAQGISRFTTCVLQSGVEIPYRAIKTNIADTLNILIQIERRPGFRYVSEVVEIKGFEQDTDRFDCQTRFIQRSDGLQGP